MAINVAKEVATFRHIVPIELWEKVQKQLKHNGRKGLIKFGNKFPAVWSRTIIALNVLKSN